MAKTPVPTLSEFLAGAVLPYRGFTRKPMTAKVTPQGVALADKAGKAAGVASVQGRDYLTALYHNLTRRPAKAVADE